MLSKPQLVAVSIFTLNRGNKLTILRDQIKHAFDKQKGRLQLGVGNEMNSALNQGNWLGYDESGIVVAKEWVSFVDDVTTNTCISLNGEVTLIGEAFSTGDFAPPANNPPHPCRSSTRAVFINEAQDLGLL